MWLPSVIASTPAANSSSAVFGVMPIAARGVLAVDDDEVEPELLAQAREEVAHGAAAG